MRGGGGHDRAQHPRVPMPREALERALREIEERERRVARPLLDGLARRRLLHRRAKQSIERVVGVLDDRVFVVRADRRVKDREPRAASQTALFLGALGSGRTHRAPAPAQGACRAGTCSFA